MPDTIATARRVLELAEIMRRTLKRHTTILEYMDAADEWGRIMASSWPEEAAKELIQRENSECFQSGQYRYYRRTI